MRVYLHEKRWDYQKNNIADLQQKKLNYFTLKDSLSVKKFTLPCCKTPRYLGKTRNSFRTNQSLNFLVQSAPTYFLLRLKYGVDSTKKQRRENRSMRHFLCHVLALRHVVKTKNYWHCGGQRIKNWYYLVNSKYRYVTSGTTLF